MYGYKLHPSFETHTAYCAKDKVSVRTLYMHEIDCHDYSEQCNQTHKIYNAKQMPIKQHKMC